MHLPKYMRKRDFFINETKDSVHKICDDFEKYVPKWKFTVTTVTAVTNNFDKFPNILTLTAVTDVTNI